MAALPVPASVYFNDFAFDVKEYEILSRGKVIGVYRGLKNSEHGKPYIHFLLSDGPQIAVGDVLRRVDGSAGYTAIRVGQDEYDGKPELVRVYI